MLKLGRTHYFFLMVAYLVVITEPNYWKMIELFVGYDEIGLLMLILKIVITQNQD